MISLLAILSSCQREGGITTAPQRVSIEDADSFGAKALKFSSSESSQTISIQTTGGEWHAYIPSGVDWLELNPSSGKTSGKTDIQVTVEKNSGFAERKANISFIADGIEQKGLLTVIQNKLYYIDLTLLNPVVNKNGGTFNIGVSCNSRWSYSIDEEGMSWLTVDSAESDKLILSAAKGTGDEKHGTITFACKEDPEITSKVEVWQKDMGLSIEGKSLTVSKEGADVTIPVTKTNISSWKVDSAPDWLTVSESGADALRLLFSANTGNESRQGSVVLKTDEDEHLSASILVSQLATAAPEADLIDIEFNADGSAVDRASGTEVTLFPGDVSVKMNEDFGVYAPVFTHTLGAAATSGYYRFPMSTELRNNLNDGCAVEALVRLGCPINGSGAKPFTSHRSGGVGLALTSSSSGNQFLFCLIQRISGSYVNNYAYSGITPEEGKYYHLVGVWDKETGTETIYVNGVKAGTHNFEGDLYFSVKFFIIGGAANDTSASKINATWNGDVLFPRIYSTPLTEAQVEAAYLATQKGKYLLENE